MEVLFYAIVFKNILIDNSFFFIVINSVSIGYIILQIGY